MKKCFNRVGCLVVNVLIFYSGHSNSNPTEVSSFSAKCCLKRIRINKKSAVVATQLVERPLPTAEVHGLNPVISKILLNV